MKNLNEWFKMGMDEYEYINSMQTKKERLLKVFNEFQLNDEDKTFLQYLQFKNYRAIAITEDWCGDAMVNLPIFMHMAEEALIETRYVLRDQNLELIDQYLTNGARSIPKIVIFDADGNEVLVWGPRAKKVQMIVGEMMKNLPEKESAEYEEAFKNFVKEMSNRFSTDTEIWKDIKEDLISCLKSI